jgi:aspartate aminotransferase-like enzyme/GNAT superfamily N-acetyltransferase
MEDVVFKMATEPWEIAAIHGLNYRTFVEEIPQHPVNDALIQIDRFHADNIYCIGVANNQLLGMVSLRTTRPFSLDGKLTNIDAYLPAGKNICEIRLLAVEPHMRYGRFTFALFQFLARYAIERGFDLGIMSGTTRQLKLYQRLGFTPFGPVVGRGEALYQPMMLSLASFVELTLARLKMPLPKTVNFLPGPVSIHPDVATAMSQLPYSHRSARFKKTLSATKAALCALTNCSQVQIVVGPGTLANDIVAAQLLLLNAAGLILSNGEFGERLLDHAARMQLKFVTLAAPWGVGLTTAKISEKLAHSPRIKWLWVTHCETSTGTLIDLSRLAAICRQYDVKLCVDCTSSVGVVPVDLTDVYLATTVSGKALAAYPGLAMIFHHHDIEPAPTQLPRTLDLGLYASLATGDIPFTHSSNLVTALLCAISREDWTAKFLRVQTTGAALRRQLLKLGYDVIANTAATSPAVITIALPATIRSVDAGSALEQQGFLLGYQSQYLQRRNWLQLCLMGADALGEKEIVNVVDALEIVTRYLKMQPAVHAKAPTHQPADA